MNAVEVNKLKKDYKHIHALDDVSLAVPEGCIYGLIGPNGAGKTTLIKALAGSLKPDSGTVKVLGMDPLKEKWKLRQHIGYMPQAYALYDDLSARENILFFGRAGNVSEPGKKTDEILEFTELTNRANDPVGNFSGGMKKRVSLACALIHNPKILFLDEPTAAVDPHLKQRSWELFRQLASKGVTLFISTHLMDEALLCDTVSIMREGKVLAEDTPGNILKKGFTVIRLGSGSGKKEIRVASTPEAIAGALHEVGLPGAINSVEIIPDDLERVVLSMINKNTKSL